MARKITHIVLHCSATTGTMDVGRDWIDQEHRKRGWSGIGYHWVIRRNGKIEAGRPESAVGAHVEGHNSKSIGVCMIGGVEKLGGKLVARDNFTAAQWATLERLVRELHGRYPDAKIVGHRDLNRGKECPSFSVRDWLRRVGLVDIAWNSGVDKPKSLAKQPTAQGAALTSTGIAGSALTDAGNQIMVISEFSTVLRVLFVVLIVGGIGLTLWGQMQANKRERAE